MTRQHFYKSSSTAAVKQSKNMKYKKITRWRLQKNMQYLFYLTRTVKDLFYWWMLMQPVVRLSVLHISVFQDRPDKGA